MLQQTQVARVLERYERGWSAGRRPRRWPRRRRPTSCAPGRASATTAGRSTCRTRPGASSSCGDFPREIAELEQLPGHRPVHRARDRVLRVRRPGDRARHQRAARARARARRRPTSPAARAAPGTGTRRSSTSAPGLPRARPRCDACPLAEGCPSRGLTFAPAAPARAASRARAASGGPRSCASSPTGRAHDDGYDRDVVDTLLADGLAVRRADGLLTLPEEVPPHDASPSRPRTPSAVSPCSRASASRRSSTSRSPTSASALRGRARGRRGLGGVRRRAGRGAAAAHAYDRSSPRSPRPTPSASGSRTSTTPSSRASAAALRRRRETGTRVAFGGRMDRSMLEHEMAADYGAVRELSAGLAARLGARRACA